MNHSTPVEEVIGQNADLDWVKEKRGVDWEESYYYVGNALKKASVRPGGPGPSSKEEVLLLPQYDQSWFFYRRH